jgi:hypothetical protein
MIKNPLFTQQQQQQQQQQTVEKLKQTQTFSGVHLDARTNDHQWSSGQHNQRHRPALFIEINNTSK